MRFLPPLAAALGAGAVLFCGVPAAAQPAQPAQPLPNCTAADLAGISTGVAAATSAYLFTHPPLNDFFTSIRDMPEEQKAVAVTDYMNANPQAAADLRGIRAPLTDFRNRCGEQ